MPSDSNYAAVTRHRRGVNAKDGRSPVLEIVDQEWAEDKLSDDEIDVARHELDAGGFEEGELDADAIVVSPAGNSSSANTAADRRRREEGWNDLGLDQLDRNGTALAAVTRGSTSQQG
mmetsp:Transcript_79231/g.230073  ORF Transcript_79231/g.230073 Transcript_79231/m.230073 type:complete len:118 (+) Transcript_79231:173-526(+)|eukprot:CAMPEP_0176002880 /NCGR_PEP_ID=MMETSP0120_2-20121206/880_1 /TAXON_ID=160619 /ORGANISM="Kryptoperidinium foliaceum, Strain CCMP 1326" /LENGTH=117 /DNA_ID=CAMNT_0017335493 /DNA_START=233 /DNA_END=586 /DNA_ORIENTATION=-